ncbi:MAG: right-handed parallel beta-helix repeat-containing protein [Arachnia propionica]|uniref:right-handed parallel beta-helix repeat-containing protein n=1 Tax=Arachnia propionica TaxID=1750 RepID=UPI00270D7A81|nr:right-handed parallel beta-helix repeat-containing protein [Arachnia propionica]
MKPSRLTPITLAALCLLTVGTLLWPATSSAAEPLHGPHLPAAALDAAPRGGDDTASLKEVIAEAASKGIGVRLKPGATYVTTAELELPDGLTFLDGQGATIVAKLPATGEPGNVFRFATHSSGTTLTDVRIDLSGSAEQTRGVLAASVTEVTISNLEITNSAWRAIDVVANQGPVRDLSIHHNTISGPQGAEATAGSQAISVTSHPKDDRFTGPRSAAWDRFRETGQIATPEHEASRVVIDSNRIDGGYYGIALSGATDCTITGNTSTNNERNLSMQDRSNRNHVRGNDFTESESSAIHLAYGSSHNVVEHNRISTGRAHGQGLLQAYQGSTNNTFRSNRVEAHGDARPSWFMYVATGSHDTVFEDNTLIGKAGSAVAAAESIWDTRSAVSRGMKPNPHSYQGSRTARPGTETKVDFAGGHEDLRNISFTGNTLATTGQPFYLGAEVTLGPNDTKPAVGNLTGIRISGNQLKGSGWTTPVVEHRGSLKGVGTAGISYTEKQ